MPASSGFVNRSFLIKKTAFEAILAVFLGECISLATNSWQFGKRNSVNTIIGELKKNMWVTLAMMGQKPGNMMCRVLERDGSCILNNKSVADAQSHPCIGRRVVLYMRALYTRVQYFTVQARDI